MKKPPFAFRAVMLDLGRVIEKKSYYASLLPWLAEWGYNVVHLHLADDQRCALRFPSRPELASPGAYTADEMREFIALAGRHGLAVMPEVECLGHARFITEHRRYRHLAEPGVARFGFNAICPAHPETREAIGDILRDTAAIFDHPVIHVGLDEVKFGKCPRCRKLFGRPAQEWQRFAGHAAWVHQEVRRLGRRPAMWADHVLKPPEMLKRFRRDVLMFNWQYISEYDSARAGQILDAGFEVVACPATVCWQTRLVPNAGNLVNLRNTAARSLLQRRKGLVGLDNTVWCPWRYLPGAIDFGLALAGHLFTAEVESPQLAELFAKRFYGLGSGRKVGTALLALADCAPDRLLHARIMDGEAQGIPFSREDGRTAGLLAGKAAAVVATLGAERGKVRRHRERFDDLLLSAEAVLAVNRYGAALRRRSAVRGARGLYRRAVRLWGRDRDADDSLRFGDPRHHGADSLLATLRDIRA
jgi:hypothetical protein